MKTMLLFDIDGTLLAAGGVGRIAFEKSFEEFFGVKHAWGNTNPNGKTDSIIIDEIANRTLGRSLQKIEHDALCERYLFYFESEIDTSARFRLMPGVTELLKVISQIPEFHLGIATGNLKRTALLKLKRAQLENYFQFGGYGCDSHDRLELTRKAMERGHQAAHPLLVQKTFVIGDTAHDIRAGKAIQALTIAVATGGSTREELEKESPDFVLDDLTNVDQFLKITRSLQS